MNHVMVTHINKTQMREIIGMRDRGLTAANIAGRVGRNYHTLRRYIRLWDQHGPEVFRAG